MDHLTAPFWTTTHSLPFPQHTFNSGTICMHYSLLWDPAMTGTCMCQLSVTMQRVRWRFARLCTCSYCKLRPFHCIAERDILGQHSPTYTDQRMSCSARARSSAYVPACHTSARAFRSRRHLDHWAAVPSRFSTRQRQAGASL